MKLFRKINIGFYIYSLLFFAIFVPVVSWGEGVSNAAIPTGNTGTLKLINNSSYTLDFYMDDKIVFENVGSGETDKIRKVPATWHDFYAVSDDGSVEWTFRCNVFKGSTTIKLSDDGAWLCAGHS
jgi:hypothetical protein